MYSIVEIKCKRPMPMHEYEYPESISHSEQEVKEKLEQASSADGASESGSD